ncbi:MAG TPA: transglycosylase SLT domain-containing protein [Kofleriaceae bacterium]|nr:transglycosylase SLT domain-containing protein [Kofleriaceae bacterium]
MATAATRVGIAILVACGGLGAEGAAAGRAAHAGPAQDLGAAMRAYDAGDLAGARRLAGKLDEQALKNRDYLLWLRGMIALRTGEPAAARAAFERLAKVPGTRFLREVPWRLADAAWDAGDRAGAARQYARLVADKDDDAAVADVGIARFRIAEARAGAAAAAAYRAFLLAHPAHPLAARAERRLAELGGAALTPAERIERAKQLLAARLWDEAVEELALVGDAPGPELARQRDYWLGTSLFKMRRRYGDAGKLLLGVYPSLGASAPEAMFHGARALSRADRDDEAIVWYGKVVAAFPRTAWAEEAQYLRGWLEFNRGRYREALAPLEETLRRYPKSKWVDDALWFIGLSHYLLGEPGPARARLEALARRGGSLEGGKGAYWLARLDAQQGQKDAAIAGYTKIVQRFPFSWYALLARARLTELGVALAPFGGAAGSAAGSTDARPRGAKLAAAADEKLAADPLIARADELIAAGLLSDAGNELLRDERGFLRRHDRAAGLAMLLDRYRKAGNYTRPWTLATLLHGGALGGPPEGDARRWWEHAYPRAFQALVEEHQGSGKNPDGYLYSIMRQESGFDPHVVSYADARGLLQMIPPTTMRVAKELGIAYDAGRLFDPAYNIQTGSSYIGRLLTKFKGQVPLGAGSFNSGPRPVMRWLDQHGDRPMDELVELVPYTQTRDYMKHVTEHYARYRYLYWGEVYEQPLVVDKRYVRDQLTY